MFETLFFFIFSIVIGLMFLFFGYVFFRILLPIWGFFAGLMFGVNGINSLMGDGFLSTTLALVIGIAIGLVFAVLAYYLYAFAVYVFGISIGYVLGSGLMMALGVDEGFLTALVGILGAVGLTIVFVWAKMPRMFLVVLTALAGSMAVIMGILVLFGQIPEVVATLQLTSFIVANSWFWIIAWAVLAAIGMSFQYFSVQTGKGGKSLNGNYDWKKEYAAL